MCKYILTLIKSIHSLLQAACFCFKEYFKTMNIKAGFKQFKTYPCLLYIVNELGTVIFIVYIYDTLTIRYKP